MELILLKGEINLLKLESVDQNVSRGQMRDQIVANSDVFCGVRP